MNVECLLWFHSDTTKWVVDPWEEGEALWYWGSKKKYTAMQHWVFLIIWPWQGTWTLRLVSALTAMVLWIICNMLTHYSSLWTADIAFTTRTKQFIAKKEVLNTKVHIAMGSRPSFILTMEPKMHTPFKTWLDTTWCLQLTLTLWTLASIHTV